MTCVSHAYRKNGFGKLLLDHSLKKAAELGCGAYALNAMSSFMAKVVLLMPSGMVSGIMDCWMAMIHPFFCAKN